MELPLTYYGNPILRKKCAQIGEIDEELRLFIKDLEETLIACQGYGIAAPQVGKALALFLVNIPIQKGEDEWEPGQTKVYINPKIVHYSPEEWERPEACLSIPGVSGRVSRPVTINIEATNLEGKRFTETLTALEARAFMHENDHINGVLYIDRVRGKEREAMEPLLRKIKKKYATP
jgi:peptide deformylase